MANGKLFMIPTTLGGNDINKILPSYVKEIIYSLDEFIVENEKKARAFFKSIQTPICQNQLIIHVLNKKTNPKDSYYFLKNCRLGKSIGLLSDAGCPGIADPGSEIVKIAHKENIQVSPLVGPSSILLAIMASGMNGQSFTFHGYLPSDLSKLKKKVKQIERKSIELDQTQIFIETPYRNTKLLECLLITLYTSTKLCIACDISLKSEFIKTKTIGEWRSSGRQNIYKRPCIFLIYTN